MSMIFYKNDLLIKNFFNILGSYFLIGVKLLMDF